MRKRNLLNQRFGLLVVIEETNTTKYEHPSKIYVCKCDCGNTKEIPAVALSANSNTKSCGCVTAKLRSEFGQTRKGKKPKNTLAPGESSFNALFDSYQRSALRRNLAFELSKQQFRELVTENCTYCGTPPSKTKKIKQNSIGFKFNGIDRADNNFGYTVNNSVTCCFVCNRAKDVMTQTDFYLWLVMANNHLLANPLKTIS